MRGGAVNYPELVANYRWHIPERYNIGVDACDRWADGSGRSPWHPVFRRRGGQPLLGSRGLGS